MRRLSRPLTTGFADAEPLAAKWLTHGLTRTATPKGRLLPGLHKLDVERDWLLHDSTQYAEELRHKKVTLQRHRDTCFRINPAADTMEAQREVLDMVVEYLPVRYPNTFSLSECGQQIHVASSRGSGAEEESYDLAEWRAASPLELAGLLVQEDLALVQTTAPGVHILQAAFVVFSFGRLHDHVGTDLSAVHGRVDRFDSDLKKPVTRFFDKLTAEAPAWRTNFGLSWSGSIVPSPDRYPFRPAYAAEATLDTPAQFMLARMAEVGVGDAIWLKTEYQTIRRLNRHEDCSLFTVRTFVDPLKSLSHVPSAARWLAYNMRCASEGDFKYYLGIEDDEVRGVILDHLDGIAGAAPE